MSDFEDCTGTWGNYVEFGIIQGKAFCTERWDFGSLPPEQIATVWKARLLREMLNLVKMEQFIEAADKTGYWKQMIRKRGKR